MAWTFSERESSLTCVTNHYQKLRYLPTRSPLNATDDRYTPVNDVERKDNALTLSPEVYIYINIILKRSGADRTGPEALIRGTDRWAKAWLWAWFMELRQICRFGGNASRSS